LIQIKARQRRTSIINGTGGPAVRSAVTGPRLAMAKLSVEKALQKIRSTDAPKSRNARRDEENDALDEEIKRMRAQRLRLEKHQQRSAKRD
jgi:hypothetical protein